MENIKVFTIGKKVRWFYEDETDEEVFIGNEVSNGRVRIDRKKNGKMVEGGYINTDELYEL